MLFLSLLWTFVSGSQCPQYSCGSSSTTLQCYSNTTSSGLQTIQITPCSLGLICPIDPSQSTASCSGPALGTRYPGEYCSDPSGSNSDEDCISPSRCLDNVCYGKPRGLNCTQDSDCNPGLYCIPNVKCTPQLSVGTSCASTNQCVNSAVCDFGVCVLLFSLPIGSTTQVIDPKGLAYACSTGYASQNAGQYTCATAPTSSGSGLNQCNIGQNCTSGTGNSQKACMCGYNGQSYCPLFEGDTMVQFMIKYWPNIFPNATSTTCHTSNRWSYACFVTSNYDAFYSFLYWSSLAQNYFEDQWVLSYNNLPCVQQTLTADYWNTVSQFNSLSNCPVYECENSVFQSNTSQCTFYYSNIFYSELLSINQIYQCNSTSYCMANLAANSSCIEMPSNLAYPGQNCSSNLTCLSNWCSNNICQGKALNQQCSSVADCNPGLYCNNGQCLSGQQLNSPCNSTFLCGTGMFCDGGSCQKYFSLPVDFETFTYENGFAPACQYGFAVLYNESYFCDYPPMSSDVGINCNGLSDCTDQTNNFTKPCLCGLDGNQYCGAFEGDPYLVNAINAYINISTVPCNTATLNTAACYENNLLNLLNYYYYYTNFTLYQSWPTYLTGSQCAQNTYASEYYNAVNQINYLIKVLHPKKSFALHLSIATLLISLFY